MLMTLTDLQHGRINHCAGCTMGGAPAARGPNQLPNLKKTFGGRKCTPEKIMATRMRKGPPPYAGMGPRNG